jgi:hypothetical protein
LIEIYARFAHLKKVKINKMKKFLAILLVAGFMISCNNSAETSATAAADSVKTADSLAKVAAEAVTAVDSTKKAADSTIKATVDTVKAATDKMVEKAKDVKEAVKH